MFSVNDICDIDPHRRIMGWSHVPLVKLPHACPIAPRHRRCSTLRGMGATLRQAPSHPNANLQQQNSNNSLLAESSLRPQHVGRHLLHASLLPSSQRLLNHHIRRRYSSHPPGCLPVRSYHRFHINETWVISQDSLGWVDYGCLGGRNHDEA